MKDLFVMMICLFSFSALAKPTIYEVTMELSLGEEPASSSRITIEEGQQGMISFDTNQVTNQIEVIAKEGLTPEGEEMVTMDFVISTVAKDSTKTILARPSIATIPYEPAKITIGQTGTTDAISLSVLANKVMR